jgi:hypothetical protein
MEAESHIELPAFQGPSGAEAAEGEPGSVSETSDEVAQVALEATAEKPRPTLATIDKEQLAALKQLRDDLEQIKPSRGQKWGAGIVAVLGVIGTIVGAVYGGWGGLAVALATAWLCNRILSTQKAQNKLIEATAPQMNLTPEQVKSLLQELAVKKQDEIRAEQLQVKAQLEKDLAPLVNKFNELSKNPRADHYEYYSSAKLRLAAAQEHLRNAEWMSDLATCLANAGDAIKELRENLKYLERELSGPDPRGNPLGDVAAAAGYLALVKILF